MRFGILIVFIALIVMLFLSLCKGRQANPVAQCMAGLEKDDQQDLYLISAGPARVFASGADIKRRQ
jgi:hypothetical protein